MQRNITAKALASQAFFRTRSGEGALACREIFATSADRGVPMLARQIGMRRGARRAEAMPGAMPRGDALALQARTARKGSEGGPSIVSRCGGIKNCVGEMAFRPRYKAKDVSYSTGSASVRANSTSRGEAGR